VQPDLLELLGPHSTPNTYNLTQFVPETVLQLEPVGEAYSLNPLPRRRGHFAAGRNREGQGGGMEGREEGKGKKKQGWVKVER